MILAVGCGYFVGLWGYGVLVGGCSRISIIHRLGGINTIVKVGSTDGIVGMTGGDAVNGKADNGVSFLARCYNCRIRVISIVRRRGRHSRRVTTGGTTGGTTHGTGFTRSGAFGNVAHTISGHVHAVGEG